MKKILIIDDESHIRMLLEQTLEDLEEKGVQILSASDGISGLSKIKSEKPDLVFLDVMMPGKSGFEVSQEIKSNPEWKDIYVILLTAKGQQADKSRGIESGADEFETKPFDPDVILEKAKKILKIE